MNRSAQLPAIRLAPRQKYLSLALVAMQRALTYRGSIIINILSQLVWVAVSYFVWEAVFAADQQIGSFDWARMKTYLVVAYAVNLLFYSSSSVFRIMTQIRTGDIALELIRPFSFLGAQLAQAVGSLVIEGLLGALSALVVGVLLDILLPASWLVVLLFGLSVALGFLIKFLVHFLVALLCFWTINWLGLYWAETAIVQTLSGALIPLAFLPDWLRLLAGVLPFQGIVSTPLAIYLGELQGRDLWLALALQLFWVGALWLLIRCLWHPVLKALEIQRG